MAEYGYAFVTRRTPSPEDVTKVYRHYVEIRDLLADRGVHLTPMELIDSGGYLGWKAESKE